MKLGPHLHGQFPSLVRACTHTCNPYVSVCREDEYKAIEYKFVVSSFIGIEVKLFLGNFHLGFGGQTGVTV